MRGSFMNDLKALLAFQHKPGFTCRNLYFQYLVPEINFKGKLLPLFRDHRIKGKLPFHNPHSPKTFHYAHPGTCHTGDMTAFPHLVVIVVEVKSGGPEVEFIRLSGSPQYCGLNAVNARGK